MEYINSNIKKEDKKVWIALSADYGNVGDLAITIAQKQIIKETFPDRKIVEIPMRAAYDYENRIKEILNDDDICTIIGGGNFGNIYLSWEERRRFIIDIFKNNKIITFPQTIDFLNNDKGKEELQKSIDIYGNHPNLTILAREQKSYNTIKENFPNDVYLMPDIVLFLKDKVKNENSERKNITLCFRNDKEKNIDEDITNLLTELLNKNSFENITITDTHIGEVSVHISEREDIFYDTLKKFQNSKLIVTDRLHGLIFSIITNTPCIVFDNTTKKISSTYNTWLKNIPEIKLLDKYDEETILNYINELYNIEEPYIDSDLIKYFSELSNILKKGI